MTTNPGEPLKLFYCYAHEDKMLRDALDTHLASMKRQGLLEVWYDRQISPGTPWEHEIDKHLTSAHIILLLVSAPFLASDYCYGIEMQKALQRDVTGTARVVPIILRPVDWEDAPFSKLQVLPTGAKPVTRWMDRDDAFEDIAKELRRVVKELRVALKTKEQWTQERWKEEGNMLESIGQYEEALVAYNQAIQLEPNYTAAYIFKGITLDTLKRYEEALVAFDQAIRINPSFANTYVFKGITLTTLKRHTEALVAYNHAIQPDLNNANAYFNKGITLGILSRYEEALVAFNQAIHLDPNRVSAYNNKGVVLQRMNRENEAQAAFKRARELGYTD